MTEHCIQQDDIIITPNGEKMRFEMNPYEGATRKWRLVNLDE